MPATKLKPGLRQVRLDQLRPSEDNPRKIGSEALERLKAQLEGDPTFMKARPICAMTDGRIYAGEMRWRALRELGRKAAPTYIEDVDEETRHQRMIRDNTHPGDWVPDEVAAILDQYRSSDDLPLFGLDDDEVDGFLARVDEGRDENPDRPVEPPKKAITRRGDLWELGVHRLLCGDATRGDDVMRAQLDGAPTLMVTDPPYGVGLDHGWREAADARAGGVKINRLGKARKGKMAGDEARADWTVAYELAGAAVAYIWHGGLHSPAVAASLIAAGYEIRSQIIWVKTVAALSRGHYHWLHEPCWYAVAKGKKGNWRGGRKATTVWEAASPLHIMGGSDEPKTDHPTQKPVLLYERAIRNHLPRGAPIYDPFCGSGTVIVAAERTERVAVAIEIEPRWCDAAVQRWEELTGEKAKRVKG